MKDFVRIQTRDGAILQKLISARQSSWYHNAKTEDKEDVAIMIASTMIAEEILMEYLTHQPIKNYQANIKSVSAVKQKDGVLALRIMMNDGIHINKTTCYYLGLLTNLRSPILNTKRANHYCSLSFFNI